MEKENPKKHKNPKLKTTLKKNGFFLKFWEKGENKSERDKAARFGASEQKPYKIMGVFGEDGGV